ncbi:MAG TPA: hypothetical protein PKH08_05610 [Clostridia bacterium]|jgi:hypothetical protein|nr:hypothetical protein [Clostridia bacterium]
MEAWAQKIKNGWAKVKTIKNIEIIIGLVIICLIVLIYSSITAGAEKKKPDPKLDNGGYTQSATELEKRLGDILSEIDGAGKVSVMITYEAQTANSGDGDAIEGIKGVVVVADGAENPAVRIRLITALRTLLDIDADSIQIFDRK